VIVTRVARAALRRTLDATLFALEQALAHQAELDKEIAALAEQPPYREPVGWLRCFRGIDTLSAMILLAEIVDFQRFPHTRELMAYLGLVPSEYSSGGAQRHGAITKAGNTHARRVLVEAAWHYRHHPTLGLAQPGPAPGVPEPHLAGATAAASSVPPSRRARQTAAGRGDRHRPRTRRLHLGRHDAARPGGVGSPHRTRGHERPGRRRGGHDAGTIGEPSPNLCDAWSSDWDDSRA
jgi:hypothetical protein